MTAAGTAGSPGTLRRSLRMLIGALAAIAIQVALVAAWAGAMGKPALHEEPVGLVLAQGASISASGLATAPGSIAWRPLADPHAAREAVYRGELSGALVLRAHAETLYLASAGGLGTSQALGKTLTAQAAVDRRALRVRDVRPLSPGDPRGLGIFVLVLGWVIGGYAGAMLLARAMGARARTARGTVELLGWLAGYAVAAAALGVLLIDPLLDMVPGPAGALIGVGALLIFAVGTFATAMLKLLGPAGLLLTIGVLVILGNPASGGMVQASMLPDGWHFLSEIVPNSAGVRLIRHVSYFGSHGIADALSVLLIYIGASLLVIAGRTWRVARTAVVPAPAVPAASATSPVAASTVSV